MLIRPVICSLQCDMFRTGFQEPAGNSWDVSGEQMGELLSTRHSSVLRPEWYVALILGCVGTLYKLYPGCGCLSPFVHGPKHYGRHDRARRGPSQVGCQFYSHRSVNGSFGLVILA